jgi:hypothetical protein
MSATWNKRIYSFQQRLAQGECHGMFEGYKCDVGGKNDSFTLRTLVHLSMNEGLPALSFVPLARAPPKGCCPTIAPVDLSLM